MKGLLFILPSLAACGSSPQPRTPVELIEAHWLFVALLALILVSGVVRLLVALAERLTTNVRLQVAREQFLLLSGSARDFYQRCSDKDGAHLFELLAAQADRGFRMVGGEAKKTKTNDVR